MKKERKKVISLVLCLALMLTCVPLAIFATGDTENKEILNVTFYMYSVGVNKSEDWTPNLTGFDTTTKIHFINTGQNNYDSEINGDYTVKWTNESGDILENAPTDAGTYTIKVTLGEEAGKNYVLDNDTLNYKINPLDCSSMIGFWSWPEGQPRYNGEQQLPNAEIGNSAYVLPEDSYIIKPIEGKNCTNAGKAYCMLEGKGGNVIGQKELTYYINYALIELPQEQMHTYVYDGTPKATDFSNLEMPEHVAGITAVSWHDGETEQRLTETPSAAGMYKVYLLYTPDSANYLRKYRMESYVIKAHPINADDITITSDITDGSYTGLAYSPAITVKYGEKVLVEGEDYLINWDKDSLSDAGTYTAVIEGIGNYTNEAEKTFTINTVELSDVQVRQTGKLVYDGGVALTPEVSKSAIAVNNQPVSFTYSMTQDGVYGEMPSFTEAGSYEVWFKASAPNHDDYKGSFIVNVDKAENIWTTTPTVNGWVYGYTPSEPVCAAKYGIVTVKYTGTANDGSVWNSDKAPAKAGNYTMTFTVEDTDNYEGLSETVDFTIAKADYDMSGTKWNYINAFSYDEKEHTVEIIGLPEGITVSGYTGNTATAIGNYTAKVDFIYDSNNYNEPVADDLEWKIENKWTPVADKEYTVSMTNDKGWLKENFVINASDGYELSLTGTEDSIWSSSLIGEEEGEGGSITFFVRKVATGVISLEKTENYSLDKTNPVGSIEFVGQKSWNDFVDNINFDLFYNHEVTIKVEADDALSGKEKVEYAVSDKALTLDEVKELTDWENMPDDGITVFLEDAKVFVYFVRITDKAGNVTYLSTEGAEYDTTAPVISGVENDKTYYMTQKVMVTDKNLDSVTLNGEPVTEEITLEGNREAVYTIVATDKAGNSSVVTITMKPDVGIEPPTKDITEDNVTSTNPNLEESNKTASPDTNDNSNIWLWLVLMLVNVGIISGIVSFKNRNSVFRDN